MSFLKKLNPFYWRNEAFNYSQQIVDLLIHNSELNQYIHQLEEKNQRLTDEITAFKEDLAAKMQLVNSELAKKIATGEINAVEGKLLLDIHLLRAEISNLQEERKSQERGNAVDKYHREKIRRAKAKALTATVSTFRP